MSAATADVRRVPVWIYVLAGLGILGALLGLARLGIHVHLVGVRDRMRVIVRNATGAPLSAVTFVASTSGNAAPPDRLTAALLAPGAELSFRPRTNELSVAGTCVAGGMQMALSSGYIDLWTGESRLLEIRPDGTLVGSYVRPPP